MLQHDQNSNPDDGAPTDATTETPSETYRDRLLLETQETAERLNKLCHFMQGDIFPTMETEDKDLMYSQQRAMSRLVQILGKRLKRANVQFEHRERGWDGTKES